MKREKKIGDVQINLMPTFSFFPFIQNIDTVYFDELPVKKYTFCLFTYNRNIFLLFFITFTCSGFFFLNS